jgi:adenylate cyclase
MTASLTLAHHYSLSANRVKAFEFLYRAGDEAIKRAVYAEGESYFAAALEVLLAMPESSERDASELRLRSTFIQALWATKGYSAPEALIMASRARALAEKAGDLPKLVEQLWAATVYHETRGQLATAAELADKLFEIAQREGTPASLGLGHEMQLEIRFFRGDFVGSEEHFVRGCAFFGAPGFVQIQGAEAATFATASVNAWIIGHADAARERFRAVLERTQRSRFDVAFAQMMGAEMQVLFGDFTQTEALAAKAFSQCQQHGFTGLAAWSLPALGLSRAKLGRTSEGVALLRQAVGVPVVLV